jgi:two-component sensor histidine kinase
LVPLADMHRLFQARAIILTTAVLFTLSIIAFAAIFTIAERDGARKRAEGSVRDMAHVLDEYAKRTFETGDLIARDVIDHVILRGGTKAVRDAPETFRFLEDLARHSATADYLLIVDEQGLPVSLTAAFPAPATPLGDRPWFLAHKNGAPFHVGAALFSRITQEILFTYSRRINGNDGTFLGAVQVSMKLGFLDEFAASGALAREMEFGLWTLDGLVVARSTLEPDAISTVKLDPRVASRIGFQRSGLIRDGAAVMAWRRLSNWPVVVTAKLPLAGAAQAPTLADAWGPPVVAIILAAIVALTMSGLRASRRAEVALDALSSANQNLSRAVADKDLLLKEIHHRVKNNLQITGSLLRMQSRRFGDAEVARAFEETQERLHAISLVHETLYQRDMEPSVDLADYLGRLVNDLAATYAESGRSVSLTLEVAPIALSIDRAVPLGLTLNEVVTNAYRHAFPPGGDGAIRITAARRGAEIEIVVKDTGRGFSGGPTRANSLGMRLIEAFTRQLGGRFSFATDDGTVFRLTFPTDG